VSEAARERTGFLCVIAATVLWGNAATLARWTMEQGVPPLVVVELRLAISVVLLAVGFALFRPALFRIARADLVPLLVLGVGGIAAVQGSYYTNVKLVGVGLAILLQYLAPTLVVAWEALVEHRRPRPIELASLLSSTAGVALLVLADGAALARANPLGVAVGLASAVFFAFYILYAKRLLARLSPWTVLFYGFLVAALFWMPVETPARIAGAHYGRAMWGVFLAIALGSALVPFALFYAGLARLRASRAGIVALLEPIVAIGSAALFLHEGLSVSQSLGALLILVGVGLASRAHAGAFVEAP
jgi:drug/metabolite transporter (DMT)-like permease